MQWITTQLVLTVEFILFPSNGPETVAARKIMLKTRFRVARPGSSISQIWSCLAMPSKWGWHSVDASSQKHTTSIRHRGLCYLLFLADPVTDEIRKKSVFKYQQTLILVLGACQATYPRWSCHERQVAALKLAKDGVIRNWPGVIASSEEPQV